MGLLSDPTTQEALMRPSPLSEALGRLPSDERVGALEAIIPVGAVQEVLEQTGHAGRRCPALPHWFMVFFVIGLGLFAKDCYRQVFKHLQRFRKGGTPRRSTLTEARKALGVAPLRLLAQKLVKPLAGPDTPGAFYHGLRLMALDGFVVNRPDSPANARLFGKPQSGRAEAAFPQARVLALCEAGTHVLTNWLVKPCRRGEAGMAATLRRHLGPGLLLLWDRNFLSYKNLKGVLGRGAHLLARIKKNLIFKPTQVLADGSYLAKMYPSARHRDRDEGGIVVRIIEYTLEDPGRPTKEEVHRLLTPRLDAEEHPAEGLIVLYHERWEEELAIAEVKTHQLERPLLRSETPAGVVQEIEGLLLAHFVVRSGMSQAAAAEGIDPRRLSFTATLKIRRCRLPEVPKGPSDHQGRRRWWLDLLAEVAEEVLPPRRDRLNPRVIKCKMSKWPKKRPHHRSTPQPSMPFPHSIHIIIQ
jgi:Insertion element 4 transposase N-terminal/Transposase DDE domain